MNRRARARALRERIVRELLPSGTWWNAASRAEAHFGLGDYAAATQAIMGVASQEVWKLQSTAQQLGHLAHLREERPLENQAIRTFFETLLPGAADAARSALSGRVGLALSGGGFRAAFYHLGVLARLAELDVLRHVEVLSCVSGGSIVGACYWLALRRKMLEKPLVSADYVQLVQELIVHFSAAVDKNLRGQVQPSIRRAIWRFVVDGEQGVLDPEATARELEKYFFAPLADGSRPIYMHDLAFTPVDHDAALAGDAKFHPGRHNWLRSNKVPVFVLNATTVNTGHAWQFTPTWMGESPWAVHEAADSVPRLEWGWYAPESSWQIELARAVAASACVPGVFAPLRLDAGAYTDGVHVHLVDGGVHDNQGSVSLLALNCNVLLVSDACGQLVLERAPASGLGGLLGHATRSVSTLQERVRLASYGDLAARLRSGSLRGLMFLHMKAGLDRDPIRRQASQAAYTVRRAPLSPSGVRKDFQQALAELRTDLDVFTPDERNGLMACGYQMTAKGFQRDLSALRELWREQGPVLWPFQSMLEELTSTRENTPRRPDLLKQLAGGNSIKI